MAYDVFLSHASEDKESVALPLAKHLQTRGLRVWIDEVELELGDSLRRKIDHGLSQSKYGVVILSPAFFSKEWPNKELDALVAREDGKDKVILPIWHNIGSGEILDHSPLLAGKLAVSTQKGLAHAADRIANVVTKSSGKSALSEKDIGPTEQEVLERLGHQMLMAGSSWELRKTLYELEEYIALYPHSPEAKMLKDRIEVGMRRAEMMEAPRHCMAPPEAAMYRRSPSILRRILIVILIWIFVGVLMYLFA